VRTGSYLYLTLPYLILLYLACVAWRQTLEQAITALKAVIEETLRSADSLQSLDLVSRSTSLATACWLRMSAAVGTPSHGD
jgi:hypothetical protein